MWGTTNVQEMHKSPPYITAQGCQLFITEEAGEKKKVTHAATLSASEQVLLMTCKVKITAADGSSTIVRALINPGSSALFVNVQLAQHQRLLCSNKNARVEGVAGTSTGTQGTVEFPVFGVKDEAKKVVVKVYMLKKIDNQGSTSSSYLSRPHVESLIRFKAGWL